MDRVEIEILSKFHDATNLPIFAFNSADECIFQLRPALTPNFPKIIDHSLPEIVEDEVHELILPRDGMIGIFRFHDCRIIIWANQYAIRGAGRYEDRVPIIEMPRFRAQIEYLYFTLHHHWPKKQHHHPLITDYAGKHPVPQLLPMDPEENQHEFHAGYLAERRMLLAVEHGNLNEFNRQYVLFMGAGNFGVLSDSSTLRSKKNLAITATTLFTRAAIRGGLFAEKAYTLSDECIQKVEHQDTITNIYEYTRSIGILFLNHVVRIHRQNLPSVIYKTQEYIYDHLSETIKVTEVASAVNVSASYLMHVYKKQTGFTVIHFVNHLKIDEAKIQLTYSNMVISHIAASLCFPSQSYFSRIFKKHTGITPMQYRKQHRII
ncbi:MAG: AraC family transcriptional regulator [Sporolactobacillus sp.]